MKKLWYLKKGNGSVVNISTTKKAAENFLINQLKYQGQIFYVEVPEEDWNSMKINTGSIERYAEKVYQ